MLAVCTSIGKTSLKSKSDRLDSELRIVDDGSSESGSVVVDANDKPNEIGDETDNPANKVDATNEGFSESSSVVVDANDKPNEIGGETNGSANKIGVIGDENSGKSISKPSKVDDSSKAPGGKSTRVSNDLNKRSNKPGKSSDKISKSGGKPNTLGNRSGGNNSASFSSKFRNRVKIGFGASWQSSTVDGIDTEWWGVDDFVGTKKNNVAIDINIGDNIYYKLNDVVHPFVGLELKVRIPVTSDKFYMSGDGMHGFGYKELFVSSLNIGAKINVTNNFSIAPYGLVGVFAHRIRDYDYEYNDDIWSDTNIAFTAGGGIELIMLDRCSIGLEYRYSKGEFKHIFKGTNAVNHTVATKFSVYFF